MEEPTDSVTEMVRADLLRRSKIGIAKYGTTLDRSDLTHAQWLQHTYEEALDLAQYLKRCIVDGIEASGRRKPTLAEMAGSLIDRTTLPATKPIEGWTATHTGRLPANQESDMATKTKTAKKAPSKGSPKKAAKAAKPSKIFKKPFAAKKAASKTAKRVTR